MAKHAEHYIMPTSYLEKVYRVDPDGQAILVAEGFHPGPSALAKHWQQRFPGFAFEVVTVRVGAR